MRFLRVLVAILFAWFLCTFGFWGLAHLLGQVQAGTGPKWGCLEWAGQTKPRMFHEIVPEAALRELAAKEREKALED